jgi:hypothetical protein
LRSNKSATLGKKSARPAAQDRKQDLVVSLRHLRLATREIGRTYISRVERDILELMDAIEERAKRDAKIESAQEMLRTLEELSVKPQKGRRKDLRRIEKAVDKMMRLVAEKK